MKGTGRKVTFPLELIKVGITLVLISILIPASSPAAGFYVEPTVIAPAHSSHSLTYEPRQVIGTVASSQRLPNTSQFSHISSSSSVPICSDCLAATLYTPSAIPSAIGFDPIDGDVYVAGNNTQTWVINASSETFATNITTGQGDAMGIAYDSMYGSMYVADWTANKVYAINTTTYHVEGNATLSDPGGLTYDPVTGDMYAPYRIGGPGLDVISGKNETILKSLYVGTGVAPTYDPSNGNLYAPFMMVPPSSCLGCPLLSVINATTNSVVASVPTSVTISGISPPVVYDPANRYLYLPNIDTGSVDVISGVTNTVITSLQMPSTPEGITYDPTNGDLYVAMSQGGSLVVISGSNNTVVGTITDPGIELPATYNPQNGLLYVLNSNFQSIDIVSSITNAIVGRIPLDAVGTATGGFPPYPQPPLFDPVNGDIYAISPGSDGVYIITSHPESSMSLTWSASNVEAGQPVTLTTSVNGSLSPFSYVYHAPTAAGCATPPDNSSSITCVPLRPKWNFTVSVNVTDIFGDTLRGISPVVFTGPAVVTITPSLPTVDVNETVTFATSVTGDLASFSYTYTSPTMAGCALSTSAALTCIPKSIGTFAVSVTANDSYGNSWTATSVTIKVDPALLVNLTISSSTPLLAQTVAFTTNASGGNPPYNYTYLGLPHGCYSENKSSIGCLPTQSDWYNITVVVTDMNNGTAKATVSMHVIFDFNVVIPASSPVGKQLTIMVDTNETFNGSAINKSVLFSPDSGYGTFTYSYSGLPPGCTSADVSVLTCTPTQAGKYSVTVSVHDQAGDHQTHTVLVNIVPSSNNFLGLPGYAGYLLIGAIVVAGVVGTTLLVLKKRRSSPPAWTEEANKDRELEKGEDGRETDETSPKPEKTAMGEGSKSNE